MSASLQVPHPYAAFTEGCLEENVANGCPRSRAVAVASIEELLLSANRSFPLVTIHRQKVRPGRVRHRTCHGSEGWALLALGNRPGRAFGNAKADGVTGYEISTRVDFGGEYEDALQLVGGRPPGGENEGWKGSMILRQTQAVVVLAATALFAPRRGSRQTTRPASTRPVAPKARRLRSRRERIDDPTLWAASGRRLKKGSRKPAAGHAVQCADRRRQTTSTSLSKGHAAGGSRGDDAVQTPDGQRVSRGGPGRRGSGD